MNISNAINNYLSNCRADGKSSTTLEYYETILRAYQESHERHGYTEPSPQTVSTYKNECAARGGKTTTIGLYLAVLFQFFTFCQGLGMIEQNPCNESVMPNRKAISKIKNRPYEGVLTAEQFVQLISSKRPKGQWHGKWERNHAIVVLLATTGIRNSELCALTPQDLDFENSFITIRHGKGDKYRTVSFPPVAQEAITDYLARGVRPKSLPDTAPLFGVSDTQRCEGWVGMERRALSELVRRTVKDTIGVDGKRTHAMRHACASIMYDKGMSKDEIQELLGHSDAKTTERYITRLSPHSHTSHANELFAEITQTA